MDKPIVILVGGFLGASEGEPTVRGQVGESAGSARLLLNVRAHIGPDVLRRIVDQAVEEACPPSMGLTVEGIECFSPARPVPTHRYASVV